MKYLLPLLELAVSAIERLPHSGLHVQAGHTNDLQRSGTSDDHLLTAFSAEPLVGMKFQATSHCANEAPHTFGGYLR